MKKKKKGILASLRRRLTNKSAQLGTPGTISNIAARRQGTVSKTSAGNSGTLANWNPRRLTTSTEARERESIVLRAMDLEANDPHVSGLVESMNLSTVGVGYTPQSRMNADILPLKKKKIRKIQRQAEWNFSIWSKEADIQGKKHFNDILLLADRSMLVRGEYLILPRMIKRPGRTFSLALQVIDPLRLKTPSDLMKNENIVDGIEIDDNGMPLYYWIQKGKNRHKLTSKNFVRIKAFAGHRPQVLHGFIQKDPDQYRGYVFFSPAMKFFRDLSDHLDAELVSNIVTSAAALFISSPDPTAAAIAAAGGEGKWTDSLLEEKYQNVVPGQILYGALGQKPEVLEHNRPGDNFEPFVDVILRAASSCAGIPYEVAAKRYGDMSYSSARAALLDAWRVFNHRQNFEARHLCQPCWDMVMEESFLLGMLDINDFYQYRPAVCRATWTPQKKGMLEPVKEMQSNILGLKYNILNHSQIHAENGGDWEADMEQSAKEKKFRKKKKLKYPETGNGQPKGASKENAK